MRCVNVFYGIIAVIPVIVGLPTQSLIIHSLVGQRLKSTVFVYIVLEFTIVPYSAMVNARVTTIVI